MEILAFFVMLSVYILFVVGTFKLSRAINYSGVWFSFIPVLNSVVYIYMIKNKVWKFARGKKAYLYFLLLPFLLDKVTDILNSDIEIPFYLITFLFLLLGMFMYLRSYIVYQFTKTYIKRNIIFYVVLSVLFGTAVLPFLSIIHLKTIKENYEREREFSEDINNKENETDKK